MVATAHLRWPTDLKSVRQVPVPGPPFTRSRLILRPSSHVREWGVRFAAMGREPIHGPSVALHAGNGGITRPGQSSSMPQMASARMQAHSASTMLARHLAVHRARRKLCRGAAPGAELILALVSVSTVPGSTGPERKLGPWKETRAQTTSDLHHWTGFAGPDSSAADRRNWFRGNSLQSCVVRSVGGEQQK
jgi:hypothetical protein